MSEKKPVITDLMKALDSELVSTGRALIELDTALSIFTRPEAECEGKCKEEPKSLSEIETFLEQMIDASRSIGYKIRSITKRLPVDLDVPKASSGHASSGRVM